MKTMQPEFCFFEVILLPTDSVPGTVEGIWGTSSRLILTSAF